MICRHALAKGLGACFLGKFFEKIPQYSKFGSNLFNYS